MKETTKFRDLSESFVELYVADELAIYKSTNLIGKKTARRIYHWRINFFSSKCFR